MTDDTVALIGQLLRHAEATSFEAERDTFLKRAMLLAARHDIDLALARAQTARKEAREVVEERRVEIGASGSRGLAMYVRLYLVISEAYGIKCLIASNSTIVYPMGFPSDLDLAEAIYGSVVVQMVGAGDRYVRSRTGASKRVHGATARQQFYAGFVREIGERLTEAQAEAALAVERDAAAQRRRAGAITTGEGVQAGETMSVDLVLREKAAAVDDFYRVRSRQARGSWRGSRPSAYVPDAQRAGRAAGRDVDLHQRRRRSLAAGD